MAFARILVISRMYGIDISPECNFAYLFLDDYRRDCETEIDYEYDETIAEMSGECREEIQSRFKDDDEMFDLYFKYDRFLSNVFRAEGFVDDYAMLCNDGGGLERRLARTLAILRKTFKNREFTNDELMIFASIYEAAEALTSIAIDIEEWFDEIIYGDDSFSRYYNYSPMFKAEEVLGGVSSGGNSKSSKEARDKKNSVNEKNESPKYKEETLIAEIDALHRKIHQQEGDIKELRSSISGYRKVKEENDRLKEQLDSEHKELVALREHVYSLTEDDEAGETISVDGMKDYLREKRIIIVGGHSNWRQKMKAEFPDWVIIDATVSGTMESSVVDKADYVYFFTDTISHSTYYKYMNVVKEHGIDFGYIHGVNIENTVRKMYRELNR